MDRWSEADANAWWAAKPWVCGFNFLPSTAVNFLEMWHRDTFDKATIERELGWAREIGFNAFRINLHYLVWKHDRDGMLQRFDWVMDVAHRLGIHTVPCLFDDCGFGGSDPEYGPQPDPVPGVHNSRAVASPGRALLVDREAWPGLERYVTDLVRTFRDDPRVMFWDLYNEPGNRMIFEAAGARHYEPDVADQSLELMLSAFAWSRSEAPSQPLTVAAWTTKSDGANDEPYQTLIDRRALDLSDIVTFHAYRDTGHVRRILQDLARFRRPMLCTEWMARTVGSRIADQLDLFKDRKVGCFQWGLVQGRTQTYLPWPANLVEDHGGHADRSVWFHDLLDRTGRPYDPAEIEKIRALAGAP